MAIKNLYVGNLPFGITDAELEQLFGQYGTVTKAQIISDRETGRSRGQVKQKAAGRHKERSRADAFVRPVINDDEHR